MILAVCMAPRLLPAATAEVASVESLRAEGVTCRRVQLQALTASVQIEVTVDESRAPGRYQGAECVVLKDSLPAEGLAAADAATADGKTVARKARSTKTNPVFLVLGREVPRAYLAFQFSGPGDSAGVVTHRYLLPVNSLKETPAEDRSDPAGAAAEKGAPNPSRSASGPP